MTYDIAVVGGGFGGTLAAMIAATQGLDVVVLERERHPRFAIGESSTPLANLVLEDLSHRYGLDELLPLCRYGTWRAAYPDVRRGPKRGFSFFAHRPNEAFESFDDHRTELLVASNASEADADTQWLRSDVDALFAQIARARGVDVLEGVAVRSAARAPSGIGWVLEGASEEGTRTVEASFVVDASGGAAPLAQAFGLLDATDTLRTRSRAIFSHFESVGLFADIVDQLGGSVADHPFPADAAALHHLTPEGWLWTLRFDHGVTSVGAVLREPSGIMSAQADWDGFLGRYPSIAAQLVGARPVRPLTGTGRLQRRVRPASGADWLLLPAAAYFVDPLLSPGNAHTMYGVERLGRVVEVWGDPAERAARLTEYDRVLQDEIEFVDILLHGCHAAFAHFPLMAAFSLYYFAGAIVSETRRRRGHAGAAHAFLDAHEPQFRQAVEVAHRELMNLLQSGSVGEREVTAFTRRVYADIRPIDIAGLADPSRHNMHPHVEA